MERNQPCKKCKKKTFFRDEDTQQYICSTCNMVQDFDFDNYDPQLGGFNAPPATFIHAGSNGNSGYSSYKEKKVVEAKRQIDDFGAKLDFSKSKTDEVKAMIDRITQGEFGQGKWFTILIGACYYVAMNTSMPFSMPEVATIVQCDLYELGRMINRVVDFLDMKVPDFNMIRSFEGSLGTCSYFENVSKDTIKVMREQGVFLLQCAVKWFLTTGRKPLPMVAAVMVFVAEMNHVEVKIEDIANEVKAVVSTSKTRYKELLKALIKVAQALPWGVDITVKNIKVNAPFVLKYMELKSKGNTAARKRNNLQGLRIDMDEVVNASLIKVTEFGNDSTEDYGSQYYEIRNRSNRLQVNDNNLDNLRMSHENLLLDQSNFLEKVRSVKEMGEIVLHKGIKRSRSEVWTGSDLWTGDSAMSTQLSLKHLLDEHVGLSVMPPSFLYGCLVTEKRREKIKAAKLRINKIMHPANGQTRNDNEIVLLQSGKRQRRRLVDGTKYEDVIILHQVKEEEIEKGHYKTLLDLYVFNSGVL